MAGLVPAIHVFEMPRSKTWMPGTRPGMTKFVTLAAHYYFFTIGHAGSGGPNASAPEILVRIL
jgi:hypothetical protein